MQDTGNPWIEFFDGFASEYPKEIFTQNTIAEIDFLIDVVGLYPGTRVLDMGCGTGRHSVELARRGFLVTGVDLSAGMLAEAEENARAAGVAVKWIREDATRFSSLPAYDAALCLCEGAFGLLAAGDGANDQPLAILRGIHGALVPGAPFVLTCLNALRSIRSATARDVAEGRFDPNTLTEIKQIEWDSPDGRRNITMRERAFAPTEIEALCRWTGFEVVHVWGGTAGNWGCRPVDLDEMEVMVVARKPAT